MLIKMGKLNEACALLKSLGLPKEQTNDLAGLVFLALAYLSENDTWPKATDRMYTTRQIMDFIDSSYGVSYAPNSRETIRRKALHQFEQAQLVVRNHDDPKRATNSPLNNYKLSPIALAIIPSYPNGNWR
jgi:adenine-specific DNA-methyltransferase